MHWHKRNPFSHFDLFEREKRWSGERDAKEVESSERRLQLIENFSLALNCLRLILIFCFFCSFGQPLDIAFWCTHTHSLTHTDTHAQNNGRKQRRNISIFCSFYFGIDLIFSFDGWMEWCIVEMKTVKWLPKRNEKTEIMCIRIIRNWIRREKRFGTTNKTNNKRFK